MTIILDANIIIRAVLGRRVRALLDLYQPSSLTVPDMMVEEARRNLTPLLARRAEAERDTILLLFDELIQVLRVAEAQEYSIREVEARARLRTRDTDDWPVIAIALVLGCPIWTEDRDFFGCGVATWTTDRIEIFFRQSPQRQ